MVLFNTCSNELDVAQLIFWANVGKISLKILALQKIYAWKMRRF